MVNDLLGWIKRLQLLSSHQNRSFYWKKHQIQWDIPQLLPLSQQGMWGSLFCTPIDCLCPTEITWIYKFITNSSVNTNTFDSVETLNHTKSQLTWQTAALGLTAHNCEAGLFTSLQSSAGSTFAEMYWGMPPVKSTEKHKVYRDALIIQFCGQETLLIYPQQMSYFRMCVMVEQWKGTVSVP